jgi:hypothetical protein
MLSFNALAMDPAKEGDIRELMELMGTAKMASAAMKQSIPAAKAATPQAPAEFWVRFEAALDVDAIVELNLPIYDKHYTHKEIEQLIKFYKTPLGRKISEVGPQITQEAMEAGQKWGASLGAKIMTEIMQENAQQ